MSDGRARDGVIDFGASTNPLGPPAWLRAVVSRHLSAVADYPDPHCPELTAALAQRYGVLPEQVVVGSGSSELLLAVCHGLAASRALLPSPTWRGYARAAQAARLPVVELPLIEVGTSLQPDWAGLPKLLQPGDLLVVGRPHDLSGDLPSAGALRDLAAAHPAVTLVVDEALLDFVAEATSLAGAADNLVVVRSMSHFWAIPGVRLGFAVAAPEVAARLRQQMPEQAVNTLAQAVGLAALADGEYARQTVETVAAGRAQLAVGLSELGLTVYDGVANLVLGRLPAGWRAETVAHRLLADYGLAVRTVDGHDRAIQIAVRSAGENQSLLDALALVLGRPPRGPEPPRRARSLMFQGTSSHAGKSLLTAALCRILHQDGVRVAPFKAQNMSNNSYIGWDGGELGRAQVLQAQACGLDPDTRMNPVLLKPSSDTASQVILRGRPAGELVAFRDLSYHERAGRVACEAYDELAAEYEVIVLEGAGSPGEVNLKDRDIVNMRMAQHAQSPVLLVGDIDRGGVYASFVGTMEVLAEWERSLLRGFVVNKFRGDASLLGPAHDYVLNHTGRPVLGVVPYLRELGLPEEDGAERPPRGGPVAGDHRLDIAVVEVPHIANLSDFDALRLEPDVRLRVVARPDELGCPDAVLLPGTRNTIDDLTALRARGLAEALVALDGRSELVGICGGYQMLGRQVADPLRLESATGLPVPGLGMLPLETELRPEKTLCRVEARHEPSGLPLTGYEIHHGETSSALAPLVTSAGRDLGSGREMVWGTYLHGLFDRDAFRRWWLDRLRVRRGWEPLGQVTAVYDLEPALDRLAAVVREGLALEQIYDLLGLRS